MKSKTPITDSCEWEPASEICKVVRSGVARELECKLNEANDKLAAALLLCADNGINVKSITVAAMPNVRISSADK